MINAIRYILQKYRHSRQLIKSVSGGARMRSKDVHDDKWRRRRKKGGGIGTRECEVG